MPAPGPGQSYGIATNPVINVQLNPAASPAPISMGALLDAAFGSSQGQTIYRGATGWSTSAATGPYSVSFNKAGAITVADDIATWEIFPTITTITAVAACCKTAPVGTSLLISIKGSLNGSSFTEVAQGIVIDGTRLTVASTTGVLAAGTICRCDITQVGSGTAGSDLTVVLFGQAQQ